MHTSNFGNSLGLPEKIQTIEKATFSAAFPERTDDYASILTKPTFKTVNGNLSKLIAGETDHEMRAAIRNAVNQIKHDPRNIAQVKQEIANYQHERTT